MWDNVEGKRGERALAVLSREFPSEEMETRREGSLDLNRCRVKAGRISRRRTRDAKGGRKGRGQEGTEGERIVRVSRMRRLRKSEILLWTPGNLGSLVTIFYLYESGVAVVPIA